MDKDLRERLEKERDEICQWRARRESRCHKVEAQEHKWEVILTLGEIEGMIDLLDTVDRLEFSVETEWHCKNDNTWQIETKDLEDLFEARQKLGGGE